MAKKIECMVCGKETENSNGICGEKCMIKITKNVPLLFGGFRELIDAISFIAVNPWCTGDAKDSADRAMKLYKKITGKKFYED